MQSTASRPLSSRFLSRVTCAPFAALALACAVVACGSGEATSPDVAAPETEAADVAAPESTPAPEAAPVVGIENVRQLTFAGRRSGEGYFSADGKKMVFQSEREPGNPFYQIYLMDLETGDVSRVSTGIGRTTCAWIHPSGERVMFSSTHGDPEAKQKQAEEIAFRESGKERRYAWAYDESYEIYSRELATGALTQLTSARGYDAEGDYSPDGTKIVFASNRHAYSEELPPDQRELFERDPSSMMEIYIMDADGGNVRRLTDTVGYDGGPFFSADGERITWRRFAPDGATAEIYTMRPDGTDVVKITDLGAMSWAPYYHPSGDYLVFATNVHGFANFELYLAATDPGAGAAPVRVTDIDGFDGLPVFLPSGDRIAWTRRPDSSGKSQIYVGDWDDAKARALLGIAPAKASPARAARPVFEPTGIAAQHVEVLTAERMDGRRPGTDGEKNATQYVAEVFEELGLEPAGDGGTYFQPFEFTAGISLGAGNTLEIGRTGTPAREVTPEGGWMPLAFSRTGAAPPAPVVFAGYGIVTAKGDTAAPYDAYGELDVKNKWVLVFRGLPQEITPERRQELARYSSLRHKAMIAREKAARGLIVVSGPRSPFKEKVVPLGFDVSLGGTSVHAISVDDAIGEEIVAAGGKTLDGLQAALESGDVVPAFEIPSLTLGANVSIEKEKRVARNTIARLDLGGGSAAPIVIGAHVDHLGHGGGGSSLATGDELGAVHPGADDNASGVAAMLDVAKILSESRRDGEGSGLRGRDVLFAAWSGEELGLLGSEHFTKSLTPPNPHATAADREVAAYINMDMVGRLRKSLYAQGTGSSTIWRPLLERVNARLALPVDAQDDSYLPTDATSFYVRGVPILSLFTGVHDEYHTPRDTAEKLNYAGIEEVALLVSAVARELVALEAPPDYVAMTREMRGPARGSIRAFLGTVPSYGETDVVGVKLSGVAKGGPAEKAGIRADDVIVGLAGQVVENIYDYTAALEALKIGEPVTIAVKRRGERLELQITPESRN